MPPRPGDIPHSQADESTMTAAVGYVPTHQVAEGMAETVALVRPPAVK